jgi:hypothetical protein
MNLRSNLLEKVPLPKNFSEKMEKKQIARREIKLKPIDSEAAGM